jgi:hypothetical protein
MLSESMSNGTDHRCCQRDVRRAGVESSTQSPASDSRRTFPASLSKVARASEEVYRCIDKPETELLGHRRSC